jgi:hypothetical protein
VRQTALGFITSSQGDAVGTMNQSPSVFASAPSSLTPQSLRTVGWQFHKKHAGLKLLERPVEAFIVAKANLLHEIKSRRARDVDEALAAEEEITREIKAFCRQALKDELAQLQDDFEADVEKPRAKKAGLEGEIEKWSANPRYFKKVADLKAALREVEEEIERLARRLEIKKKAVRFQTHGSNARCRLLPYHGLTPTMCACTGHDEGEQGGARESSVALGQAQGRVQVRCARRRA